MLDLHNHQHINNTLYSEEDEDEGEDEDEDEDRPGRGRRREEEKNRTQATVIFTHKFLQLQRRWVRSLGPFSATQFLELSGHQS